MTITKIKIVRIFSPIRIIEIITLLSLIPYFKIHWESATLIFTAFFPIIGASIIFEGVLNEKGFWNGLKDAGVKYISGISIQFVGIAIFAISSFNLNVNLEPMIIMYSLVIVGIGVIIEVFHIYSSKKFKDIELTPRSRVLAVFAMTLLIFVASNYVFFLSKGSQ